MDSRLYLLDDNIHTFDDVSMLLQRYLGYSTLQGASIATLVHHRGRCEIKIGEFSDLELLSEVLQKEGFNTIIENDYEGY